MSAIFSPDHDRARAACPTSAKEDARSVGGLDAEGKGDLSSRLNDGLHVTDEELMRRTPLTKPSPSPSMSFSLGTTPGKQYPSRMSISPATSAGIKTPRRSLANAMKTPSRSSVRNKNRPDPMSVCKLGTASKENRSVPQQPRFSITSPAARRGAESHVDDDAARAYDRMPPPVPRTPGAKGCSTPAAMRTTPMSPLQRHNPNQQAGWESTVTPGRRTSASGSATCGKTPKHPDSANRVRSSGGAAVSTPTSSGVRTFRLGSADSRSHPDSSGPTRSQPRTSMRAATAAAARCAPTPPRRSRPISSGTGTGGRTNGPSSASKSVSSVSQPMAAGKSSVGVKPDGLADEGWNAAASGCGLSEMLAERAREFAEQASAEAMLGMPREAARGFTRALRIVPKGWPGSVELLLARAQVLSTLGKHEACAADCRAALQIDPNLLRGVTLLGHACLRLGMHEEAARYLQEGLTLAMSQGAPELQPGEAERHRSLLSASLLPSPDERAPTDPSLRAEAQRACRTGIEEASLVGSALESGARAAGHRQHEAALAAAGRVLDIAPQCAAGQEMRAASLLGVLRPLECVRFCETSCLRPRADPEDDSDWPPATSSSDSLTLTPVLAALGMDSGVARYYVSALRGCGREMDATPAVQALRCRDPSLAWCVEDTTRWAMVGRMMSEGRQRAGAGDHEGAVRSFMQALDSDPGAVVPNAEAFCMRGSSRLGQGKALEALDDCYRALSLVSVEGPTEACAGNPFVSARARALLVRGRAYLALSRLGEAIRLLSACLVATFSEARHRAHLLPVLRMLVPDSPFASLPIERAAEHPTTARDLQGCLKCDPELRAEASVHLAKAEQRQSEAGVQRRVRERQERERQERQAAAAARAEAEAEAAAAAARAEAAARAAEEEKARAKEGEAREKARAGRKGYGSQNDGSRTSRRRNPLSPLNGSGRYNSQYSNGGCTGGQRSTPFASSKYSSHTTPGQGESTPGVATGGCKDTMKTPARDDGLDRSPKIDSESYYRRLGLRKDASEAAIKKAYRKLALKYHPDKNKSEDAAQNFRLVSEAYRILTSPDSKQQYDRTHRYSIETPPSNGCDRASGYGGSRGASRTSRGHRREDESFSYSGGRAYGSSNARGSHRSRTQPPAW